MVDANGDPIALKPSEDQAHDGCRAVTTRFEKHDANYLALVKLAASRIGIRFMRR